MLPIFWNTWRAAFRRFGHTPKPISLSHQNPTLAFSSLSLASLSLTYTHLLFSSRLSLTCFSLPLSLSLYSLSLSVCDSLCVMSWTANHTKWVLAVQQWPSTAPTVFFFFFTTNPRAAASVHPYQVVLSLSLSLSLSLFVFSHFICTFMYLFCFVLSSYYYVLFPFMYLPFFLPITKPFRGLSTSFFLYFLIGKFLPTGT